ncbi:hypothetical protein AeMF1_005751 [Aphanomyces euteiches]|nr:hypothetical protein AeMF1_005751 [Aphanomyces euteiches]KAH9182188.1 hypothetical protein AeNC1_015836 [Aphanomyces euteiches]
MLLATSLALLLSTAASVTTLPIPGVCYSPFHLAEYPLFGFESPANLPAAMDADFAIMAQLNYTKVRTYYSNYYGFDIAPIAAKYKMQLYLGVYMTEESWYQGQLNSAVNAAINYPNTVKAILIGNENAVPNGPYSVQTIAAQINTTRARIFNATGRHVPVGTVQRIAEWLNPSMLELGKHADVIGVNVYPFFDPAFNPRQPATILDGVWAALTKWYNESKLLIAETGWPTGGAPAWFAANNNMPSLNNSLAYYETFRRWMAAKGRQNDMWFSMFDSRPDENLWADLEYHFGILTHDRRNKSTQTTTLAPPTTPSPPTPLPTLINDESDEFDPPSHPTANSKAFSIPHSSIDAITNSLSNYSIANSTGYTVTDNSAATKLSTLLATPSPTPSRTTIFPTTRQPTPSPTLQRTTTPSTPPPTPSPTPSRTTLSPTPQPTQKPTSSPTTAPTTSQPSRQPTTSAAPNPTFRPTTAKATPRPLSSAP